MIQVRQGDVLLQAVASRPRLGTLVPLDARRVVLAYGEVTGHAHAIAVEPDVEMPPAQLFEEPDGSRYLFVDRPCALTHDEHGRIDLVPGCYRVARQREYAPQEIRTVAD